MRAEGIETARRILCVFPRYTSSFGTFEYAYPADRRRAGVHAAAGPAADRGLSAGELAGSLHRREHSPATDEDFAWAEAVFVSGMHIQRQQMNDICRRAHAFDRAVAIGGPSVSRVPGVLSRRSTICMSANSATPPTS